MGRREDLVKRVDRETYRAAVGIPPQEIAPAQSTSCFFELQPVACKHGK